LPPSIADQILDHILTCVTLFVSTEILLESSGKTSLDLIYSKPNCIGSTSQSVSLLAANSSIMDNHVFNPPTSIPTAENNELSPSTQAVVSVRNVQLPSGAIAPNIWLETKEQPALASVSLWLRDSFTSAASQDALDDSTVHYGELSKRVRTACTSEEGQRSALEGVFQAAEHMARKPKSEGDKFVAKRIAAKLTLPKASAFGEALTLSEVKLYDEKGSKTGGFRTFACKNLKVPTLIGVNAYERKGRQPLVMDFALDFDSHSYESLSSEQHMDMLFPIERDLVDVR
jgi:dihydroneopterin aldolase